MADSGDGPGLVKMMVLGEKSIIYPKFDATPREKIRQQKTRFSYENSGF
jgi:hypothetical protein